MNRFFRSALFPLVIIAALVWLALQTLGGSKTNATALTTSDFIQKVDSGQVVSSTASPRRTAIRIFQPRRIAPAA